MRANAAIASRARRPKRLLWRLCALAAAAAVPAAAQAQSQTTWAAEARIGGRARSPGGNDGATDVAADVEVAPRLGGAVQGRGYNLALDYGATFRARQPHLSFRPEHSHVGSLQAGWRREGKPRPFLFVFANYGVLDLTNLAAPQPTQQPGANQAAPQTDPADPNAAPQTQSPQPVPQVPLDPIPRLESLLAYGVDGTVGVEVPLSPRAAWTLSGGFFHGGGADASSRRTLPVQNAPRLATRIDWQATRLDGFGVLLDARIAWFSSGNEAREGEALLAWRRQLWETTFLELRAGAAAAWNSSAPRPITNPGYRLSGMDDGFTSLPRWRVFPAGHVGLNHRFDLRTWWGLSLWANAGASPYVDRFRALAYEQVSWQGGFTATARDWVTLRFGGGASMAVGAEQQLGRMITTYLDGTLSVHPQRWWRADLTAMRSVVTTNLRLQDGSPIPPVVQWVIGLGLTVVGTGNI